MRKFRYQSYPYKRSLLTDSWPQESASLKTGKPMIRTTFLTMSLIGVFCVLVSFSNEAGAKTPAKTAAHRKGLFRRHNNSDSRSNQQNQSNGDGNHSRVYHDFNLGDIPKPTEYDALENRPASPNFLTSDEQDPTADPGTNDADGQLPKGSNSDADDQPQEFSSEMIELRTKIRRCLAHYYNIKENAGSRSPWGIMHSLIAFGVDTEMYANNRKVNAIGWLCFNGSGRGQRLFYTTNGRIGVNEGPGVQGHAGQFLAMLAQSRVKHDYPIRVGGQEFTIDDLIKYEQDTCRAKSELTFKLIGLSHYLDSDATWKCERGENWSIARLIREELAQPIVGAACGGTHRMMGFAYAVNRREKQGKQIIGQWHRAKRYVEDYHDYAFGLQNPDGSFSTNWFEGRGNLDSGARKLQTTGHILEWTVYSLPQQKLQDPRLVKSVEFLTNLMLDNRNHDWEIGPRGHAIHALVLYDQRVFGTKPGAGEPKVAHSNPAVDND